MIQKTYKIKLNIINGFSISDLKHNDEKENIMKREFLFIEVSFSAQ